MDEKDKSELDVDPLYLMDDLLDKLKILDYENSFLKHKINKPLSRTYFAVKSSNPGDQFIYFGTLSFWLLNLCGSSVQSEKKYDDPNSTSQTILMEMKNVGIDISAPPNKLRNGYGEYVCLVLNKLVNKALERKKPQFKKIKAETG